MLEKSIIICVIYCFTQGIYAQNSGTAPNVGELSTKNPIADVAHSTVSVHPSQSLSTIDPVGQHNLISNNTPIPESIAGIPYHGNPEDLTRSARGALIGGLGNAGMSHGLVETTIPIGVTNGLGGLPGTAEGMLLGSNVGSQSIGPIETIGVRGIRPDESIPGIISGLGVSISSGPISNSLFNSASFANTGALPVTTPTFPGNAILNNGLTSSVHSSVYGGLSQNSIPNGLINPLAMGPNANILPNVAAGYTDNVFKTPALDVPGNGLSTLGSAPNIMSQNFPSNAFFGSKSILASLTGIDPVNLRANARFSVKSGSPISPTGLTVQAENLLMEGKLAVAGKMPFLGAVNVDGVLPDGGKANVMYECGNGNIGMVSERNASPAIGPVNSFGTAGINPVNYGGVTNTAQNMLGLRNSIF